MAATSQTAEPAQEAVKVEVEKETETAAPQTAPTAESPPPAVKEETSVESETEDEEVVSGAYSADYGPTRRRLTRTWSPIRRRPDWW